MSYVLAFEYAAKIHKDQLYGNVPYIIHPFRVSQKFQSTHLQMLGILHDVLEDGGNETDLLLEVPSVGPLLPILKLLTKQPGTPYERYILEISLSGWVEAQLIKRADIEDHLIHWSPEVGKTRWTKYANAYPFVCSPMTDKHFGKPFDLNDMYERRRNHD